MVVLHWAEAEAARRREAKAVSSERRAAADRGWAKEGAFMRGERGARGAEGIQRTVSRKKVVGAGGGVAKAETRPTALAW